MQSLWVLRLSKRRFDRVGRKMSDDQLLFLACMTYYSSELTHYFSQSGMGANDPITLIRIVPPSTLWKLLSKKIDRDLCTCFGS